MWWCTLQQFGSTAARSGVLLALVVSLPCADHHRPTPAKTTSSSPRSAGKPQWAPPVTLRTARHNPRFAKGAQQDLSRVKARFLCCRQSVFIFIFWDLIWTDGSDFWAGKFYAHPPRLFFRSLYLARSGIQGYTMHTCEIFVRIWVILRIYWRNPSFCGKVENPVQLNDGGQGRRRWSWQWIAGAAKHFSTVQLWDKNASRSCIIHMRTGSKVEIWLVWKLCIKTFSSNLTLRRALMKEEWTILWYDIDLN